MKLLLLIIACNLYGWTFTEKDLKNYSEEQLEVLTVSYLEGAKHGDYEGKNIGLTMAAKSVAETQAGKIDNNPNHICGPHQLDVNYVDVSCELLERNPYISARYATEEFLDWTTADIKQPDGSLKRVQRSWGKAIRMYNVGFTNDAFQYEHLRRVEMAYKVLERTLGKLW